MLLSWCFKHNTNFFFVKCATFAQTPNKQQRKKRLSILKKTNFPVRPEHTFCAVNRFKNKNTSYTSQFIPNVMRRLFTSHHMSCQSYSSFVFRLAFCFAMSHWQISPAYVPYLVNLMQNDPNPATSSTEPLQLATFFWINANEKRVQRKQTKWFIKTNEMLKLIIACLRLCERRRIMLLFLLCSKPSMESGQWQLMEVEYCHVQTSNYQSAYGIRASAPEVIEQMVLCQRPIKLTWTARNPID